MKKYANERNEEFADKIFASSVKESIQLNKKICDRQIHNKKQQQQPTANSSKFVHCSVAFNFQYLRHKLLLPIFLSS